MERRVSKSRFYAHFGLFDGAEIRFPSTILTLAVAGGLLVASVPHSSAAAGVCADLFRIPKPALFQSPASGLKDPLLARAIELRLHSDFKAIVDLIPRELPEGERERVLREAKEIERREGEEAALRFQLEKLYRSGSELIPGPARLTKPRWTLPDGSPHKATFDYIEATWEKLVKLTPAKTRSTLIPVPNPVLIPGARFQEAYYWDSYFAVYSLIRSGRGELVRGQIENFLYMIDRFGLVPNGNREYYLSRSQPPLLTRMVRDYLRLTDGASLSEANRRWLRERVLPTLIRDYREFWMNPLTRFDVRTGLNHHYDALNVPRPERHSADREEELGKTYRDVRAEAESGKDFTDAFGGEATKVAGVLLNSILYGVEKDLALFSRLAGREADAAQFERLAARRKDAMDRLMRDPATGLYYDFHLERRERVPILTADTFAPVWVGIVDGSAAAGMAKEALKRLEYPGGIVSSEVISGKQWDAPYVWAPHIQFAVEGLRKIGLDADARRIAENWVSVVDRVREKTGVILEKYDAVRADMPVEKGDKYETQQGFLWSNGVYFWLVHDVLRVPLVPLGAPQG